MRLLTTLLVALCLALPASADNSWLLAHHPQGAAAVTATYVAFTSIDGPSVTNPASSVVSFVPGTTTNGDLIACETFANTGDSLTMSLTASTHAFTKVTGSFTNANYGIVVSIYYALIGTGDASTHTITYTNVTGTEFPGFNCVIYRGPTSVSAIKASAPTLFTTTITLGSYTPTAGALGQIALIMNGSHGTGSPITAAGWNVRATDNGTAFWSGTEADILPGPTGNAGTFGTYTIGSGGSLFGATVDLIP